MSADPYRLTIGPDGIGRFVYDHDAGRQIAQRIEREERERAARLSWWRKLRGQS